MSFNTEAARPAFLKNAYAALSGAPQRKAPEFDEFGRPARAGSEEEEDSDDDVFRPGRGREDDEAPAVVVLKEGKHLDRDEVDRMRASAKASGTSDPLLSKDTAKSGPSKGSLSFHAGGTKRRLDEADIESWDELKKVGKVGALPVGSAPTVAPSEVKAPAAKKAKEGKEPEKELTKEELEKADKKKKKEKAKQKKQISMLSFGDDG